MRIIEYYNGAILIHFLDTIFWEKVWMLSPWSCNNDFVILQRCRKCKDPEQYEFTHTDMLIQLHGLPIDYFTEKIALKITKELGEPTIIPSGESSK